MTRDTIGAVHKRGIQRRAQSWETVGGSEGERERETHRQRQRKRKIQKEKEGGREREEGEDRVSRTKWWCRLQHVSFNMVWFVQKSKT